MESITNRGCVVTSAGFCSMRLKMSLLTSHSNSSPTVHGTRLAQVPTAPSAAPSSRSGVACPCCKAIVSSATERVSESTVVSRPERQSTVGRTSSSRARGSCSVHESHCVVQSHTRVCVRAIVHTHSREREHMRDALGLERLDLLWVLLVARLLELPPNERLDRRALLALSIRVSCIVIRMQMRTSSVRRVYT